MTRSSYLTHFNDIPIVAFVDPDLTDSMPRGLKVATGLDALTHAIEGYMKPADGHTVTMPSQDMILGLYYLTTVIDGAKGQGRVFSSLEEAEMAKR